MKTGWAVHHLPCIGFHPQGEPEAFGFINPEQVVHAAHLIPAFHFRYTTALLPPSIAHHKCDNDEDWDWYYVNMFVDHDMFMRYQGGGDDTPMDDSSTTEEESSEESDEDMSEIKGTDAADSDQLIGDNLGDKMEEYRYSGLDQVLDDNEGDAETFNDEDALGPEDGEGPDDEVEDATL
ncbi:hypothetical protein F5141DRAFT_1221655 [Pisolithus sp. B1]|nr:hypothetical protein F5141DRAFT_1221655 [Pisolithus sp. B1]